MVKGYILKTSEIVQRLHVDTERDARVLQESALAPFIKTFEGFGSLCDKRCLMTTSPPCIFISVQRKTCPAKQHWSPLTRGTHKPPYSNEDVSLRTGGKAINILFVVCTFMLFWTGSTKRLFSPVLYCTIRTGALLQLAPQTRKLNVKNGPKLASMVVLNSEDKPLWGPFIFLTCEPGYDLVIDSCCLLWKPLGISNMGIQ